jgi:hypothetical protein
MQERVSSAASAEQRQELPHSQAEGSARGAAHAAHRHRPHLTQIMDRSVGPRPSGGELDRATFSGGFVQGCGASVITAELVGDWGTDWLLITVLLLLFTALGRGPQGRGGAGAGPPPPPAGPGPGKGVST